MDKEIIFLCLKLNDLKYENYEIEKYRKRFKIEIHECVNFLFPSLTNSSGSLTNSSGSSKKKILAKKFNSFQEWKNYIAKKKNIIIFNLITRHNILNPNFKIFFLEYFIKKKKIISFKFELDGIPSYISDFKKKIFWINQILKIKSVLNDFEFAVGIFKAILSTVLCKLFKLYPSFLVIAGQKKLNEIKKKKITDMKIINAHEENYSLSLCKKKQFYKKKNYAVFLDDRDPSVQPDGIIFSKNFKHPTNNKNWYTKLNQLFQKIETDFNTEVIVCAHPKSNLKLLKKLFLNRNVIKNETNILVKNSNLVLTERSSALNFAIIYMKPIVFLESNLSKKTIRNDKHVRLLSKLLDSKIINIDDDCSKNQFKYKTSVSKKLYRNYFNNYISLNSLKRSNYHIISKTLNKL